MEKGLYTFEKFWPSRDPLDLENQAVDIVVKKGNETYSGSLITLKYISSLFEKNKKTGECQNGSYLPLPSNTLIVKDFRDNTIRKTLDDLLEKGFFDNFFD